MPACATAGQHQRFAVEAAAAAAAAAASHPLLPAAVQGVQGHIRRLFCSPKCGAIHTLQLTQLDSCMELSPSSLCKGKRRIRKQCKSPEEAAAAAAAAAALLPPA